jgi:hypothetical protein
MLVTRVQRPRTAASLQHPALDAIAEARLRATVAALAYPRHYTANRAANRQARDWIRAQLSGLGYRVELQGEYDNIIARPPDDAVAPVVLLGAHYDTVPGTPGADDNNSAIALCLEAARVLALHGRAQVQVAVFNREEDDLLGSSEFVRHLRRPLPEAHVFEMVGYFDSRPGSQRKPAKLPIPLPATGDFIGIISNRASNRVATAIKRAVRQVGSATPLVSLQVFFGLERFFGDLLRSDHTPFWRAGLPAIMWTDTANFRNPHYHQPGDTPETLNYASLADITRMVVGHVLLKGMR